MQYYLLNSELEIIDGIEAFQSMIWTEKYSEIGDFELYLPASIASLALYTKAAREHWYIVRAEDATTHAITALPAMVIKKIELDDTYAEGDGLIITGHQLKSILYSRVITNTKEIVGDPQEEMRKLVDANCIHAEPDRIIPRLYLGDTVPMDKDVFTNYPCEGEFLSTLLTTVCKDNKLGWDVKLDYLNKRLIFEIIKGKDRSCSQEVPIAQRNPYVIFSTDFDNLIKTTYTLDSTNHRNVAVASMEYNYLDKSKDEIAQRKETFVVSPYKLDTKPTGLHRMEIYVANSAPSPSEGVTNVAVARKMIETTARTKLEEYKSTTAINGQIAHNIGHKFEQDYFMGDLVTIQNEYGQSYDARVMSVTINISATKNTVVPNFSIENYTGKEEDDEVTIPENERRCTEDGTYRACDNGGNRQTVSGYEYTDRVDEEGNLRTDEARRDRIVTKIEGFNDEKYGIPIRR